MLRSDPGNSEDVDVVITVNPDEVRAWAEMVDAISKLTIQHQELIIENAILKQENSILRAQNNHQRKIQWQRAGQ